MKLKYVLALAAVACVVVAALVFGRGAQAQEASPTSGTLLASGLSSMTGGAVGPDGAIYVVDAGTGGENIVQLPEDFGGGEANWGLTARIIRIDPDDGSVTAAAENLPSFESPDGVFSATDVAFIGDDLYWLLTGSVNELGIDWPNGVYAVSNDGEDSELFADISAFNDANPVEFPDAGPGGNPFAIERRGSGFVVSDGNYNRLLSISSSGDITILSQFDNVVPTGIDTDDSGPVLNTWFSAAPHLAGDSHVVSVAVPGGAVTQLASGPSSMIDVTSADGVTYVLQFSDYTADESAPPTPTGRIYRLEADNSLTLLVEGFVLPTSLNISADGTAYVTSLTGEVWQIEDLAGVDPLPEPTAVPTTAPPPPAPTPTAGTGVLPPDTGSGGNLDSDGSSPWLVAMLAAMALLGLGSLVVAVRRA